MKSMRTPLGAIIVMALLCIGLQGCPTKVGLQLLVSSDTLDFGADREELLLRVSKNYSSTSMGALIVSANQDWILPQDCTDVTDKCVSRGPNDAIPVRVRIDRNKLSLGVNEGKIYLNAGSAAQKVVTVLADEIMQADFLAEERSISSGQPLELTDTSIATEAAGTINRWLWEFGDGAISTRQNPTHTYTKPGIYDIALTITTDRNVSRKVVKNAYIQVEAPANLVDFFASSTNVDVNEGVTFKDISQIQGTPVLSRRWDFGDGNISTELAPVHRYTQSGIYTVSLTISTSGGDLRAVKENYIVVRSVSGIRADFSYNTSGGANPYVGEAVQFYDTSESGRGEITTWQWNFGDGVTSDEQNPKHAFGAIGSYVVTLTITSAYGTDSQEKTLQVVFRPPAANFMAMPTEQWTQNPVAFMDMSVAGYAPIVSWAWNFGDDTTSDVQNPLHIYENPGLYTITLTVTAGDSQSSTSTITKKDLVNIREIPNPPTPDFSYAPRLALTGERVFFEAANTTITDEPILEYVWQFGDDEFGRGRTVSHRYEEPGRYTVTLTVITESTSIMEPYGVSVSRIVAVDRPPVADFTIRRRDGDELVPATQGYTYVDTFTFAPSPQPSDARPVRVYNWDFGDDMNSVLPAPSHEYESEGNYEVTLTLAFRHSASRPSDPDLERSSSRSLLVKPSIYDYVNAEDDCFIYNSPVAQPITIPELGNMQVATAYLVSSMTSQCWNPDNSVYWPVQKWVHPVVIYEPVNKLSDTAMLFIDGGSRASTAQVEEEMWQIAVLTGTTVVHLKNVPSQPIIFNEEVIPAGQQDNNTGGDLPLRYRTEDSIIAYSYDEYMNRYEATGGDVDYSWPLLFPMVKSAVKAMDMTEEILAIEGVELDGFVVTGASKRGWTTWLTGAVDSRVKAIAPIVINVLNMKEHLEHHRKVYGYWAPAIYDYAQERVFDRLISTDTMQISAGARTLLEYMDPYEYSQRGRYPMPKFMLNATGDEFFVPDTAEFYYHDLEGEAHMSYVPNVGHGMGGVDGGVISTDPNNPVRMLLAWYMAVTQDKPLPQFDYTFDANGAIRVTVDPLNPPLNAYMWQATATGVRDFRNPNLGPLWNRQVLARLSGGETGAYYVTPAIPVPEEGDYTGYYVQLVYANQARTLPEIQAAGFTVPNMVFSTGVRVTPEEYPEFTGYRANVEASDAVSFDESKMPVIVVYGSPYEMGYYYGQLLAPQINAFVRDYVAFYLTQTGGTASQLREGWDLVAPFIDSRLREEMRGISEAEGITVSLDQIELAHAAALFELIGTWTSTGTVGYNGLMEGGGSALAASLNAPFYKQQCAVVYIPDDGLPHTILTHAGLTFGRVGVNLGGISALEVVDPPVWNPDLGILVDPYTGQRFGLTGLEPNALPLLRSVLYDSTSLREAVGIVKRAQLVRPVTMLLSDGRNELRGARVKVLPGGLVLEERYDLALSDFNIANARGVVYGTNTVLQPALSEALSALLDPGLSFADLVGIANMQPFAQADRNTANVVLDGTSLNVFVSIAREGGGGEYLDAFENLDPDNPDYFNMQLLLP
jgi:PKD repeat protein/PhoPQ-activated pathogenicity-related protein